MRPESHQHQGERTPEPKDEGFSEIDRVIADEYRKSTDKEQEIAEIAKRLFAEANSVISDHYKDRTDKGAQAEAVLKNTIAPWLKDLESSGRLAGLLQNHRTIEIARKIYYPKLNSINQSLTDQYGQLTLESIKSYIKTISSLRDTSINVTESAQRLFRDDRSDGWQAIITLEKPYQKTGFEFVITPWPKVGGGFGYAMAIEGYRTRLSLENVDGYSRTNVHPNIWLGLAEWINSGKSVALIQEQLQKRKAE